MRKVTAFIIFTSAQFLKEMMKIEGFNCDLRRKAKAQTQPALSWSGADTLHVPSPSLCHVNVKGLTLATSPGATDPQKGDQA